MPSASDRDDPSTSVPVTENRELETGIIRGRVFAIRKTGVLRALLHKTAKALFPVKCRVISEHDMSDRGH